MKHDGTVKNISPTGQGVTPLQLAVSLDLGDIVQVLLVTGAEVDAKDGDGKTSLHHAAANGMGKVHDNFKDLAVFLFLYGPLRWIKVQDVPQLTGLINS